MSGMDYGKLERHRRFERGRRDDLALRPSTAPRSTKRTGIALEHLLDDAVELLDAYEGDEEWLMRHREARRSDPNWRPAERVAEAIIRALRRPTVETDADVQRRFYELAAAHPDHRFCRSLVEQVDEGRPMTKDQIAALWEIATEKGWRADGVRRPRTQSNRNRRRRQPTGRRTGARA